MFVWKGRLVETMDDVIIAVDQLETPEEARSLKQTYVQSERVLDEVADPVAHVEESLRYACTYLDSTWFRQEEAMERGE